MFRLFQSFALFALVVSCWDFNFKKTAFFKGAFFFFFFQKKYFIIFPIR